LWGALVFAFMLPFSGFGTFDLRLFHERWIYWWLVLLFPGFLWKTISLRTSYPRSVLAWGVAAVAATALLSSLLGNGPAFHQAGRNILMLVAVFGLASTASHPAVMEKIWKAAVMGGLVSILLSLLGYAVDVLWVRDLAPRDQPFVITGMHPLFNHFPRLTGTFGNEPQQYGSYLLFLTALCLWPPAALSGARFRSVVKGTACLSVLGVFLTFSSAWVGLMVLLGGTGMLHLKKRPVLGKGIAAALAMLVLGAFLIINLGVPDASGATGVFETPCAHVDFEHWVTGSTGGEGASSKTPVQCYAYREELGGLGFVRSHYLDAKLKSVRYFLDSPWWGVGEEGFAHRSIEDTKRLLGTSDAIGYTSPHATFVGAFAIAGVFHGLAVILLALFSMLAWKRIAGSSGIRIGSWIAVLGLWVMGLNLDVLYQPYFWLPLGILLSSASDPERAPADSLTPRSCG